MKKLWVLVGNFKYVNIYSVSEKNLEIQLVKKFIHNESRLKKSDLVSDKPGHYAKSFNSNIIGSYSQTTDPKLVEIENFIKQVCKFLEKNRNEKIYIGIIIVSDPCFFGLIKKFSSKHVVKCIKDHESKDYAKISENQLKYIIKKILYNKIKLIFLN